MIVVNTYCRSISDSLPRSHYRASPDCRDTSVPFSLYPIQTVMKVPIRVLSAIL